MKRLAFLLLTATALLSPARTQAQAERFELGQHLRAFEAAWDEQSDADARKRAVLHLKRATFAFFANRVADSARALDRARFALRSARDPEPAVLWAESLWPKPSTRFLEPGDTLTITLTSFYPVDVEPPAETSLRLTLLPADGKGPERTVTASFARLPFDCNLSLNGAAEGDYTLRAEIIANRQVLARREQTLSVAARLSERLGELKKAVEALPKEPASTDKETARSLFDLLEGLRRKEVRETNYPAARLLAEAEAATGAAIAGKSYYGQGKTGQFWLTLAIDHDTAPVRLLVPEAAKAGQPLPLVIALHGLGGSENMFFDAYGRGAIVRQCERRGWLLVATHGGVSQAPRLQEILDAVNRLYLVDAQRVFLVGHSMGASHAVAAAGQTPERFAGVAALGGGGAVKASEALKEVHFFVGVGAEDFTLGAARSLHENLQKAGVKTVELHEYADVEHILVVQVGLPDVFAFFDKARPRR